MQMEAINLFCDVAQHRSISRAALAHGVTQSAASQRIASLERELGVQLVDRSTRPLSLTEAGELYYRGCRKIMEDYERLTRRLHGAREGRELVGEVSVAAIYSSGIDLLNRVIADFERDHPQARLKVEYLQPQNVYQRVRQQVCDLGIISYPERWSGVESVPLRDETMVVVARGGHVLATANQLHAEQLADHAIVSFDESLPIGRRILEYLRRHGAATNIINHVDNIDTIKSFVAETDAVAILPRRTVQREVEAGVLAAIELTPTLVRPVAIIHLPHPALSPLARAFIEYLTHDQQAVDGGNGAKPSAAATA